MGQFDHPQRQALLQDGQAFPDRWQIARNKQDHARQQRDASGNHRNDRPHDLVGNSDCRRNPLPMAPDLDDGKPDHRDEEGKSRIDDPVEQQRGQRVGTPARPERGEDGRLEHADPARRMAENAERQRGDIDNEEIGNARHQICGQQHIENERRSRDVDHRGARQLGGFPQSRQLDRDAEQRQLFATEAQPQEQRRQQDKHGQADQPVEMGGDRQQRGQAVGMKG